MGLPNSSLPTKKQNICLESLKNYYITIIKGLVRYNDTQLLMESLVKGELLFTA